MDKETLRIEMQRLILEQKMKDFQHDVKKLNKKIEDIKTELKTYDIEIPEICTHQRIVNGICEDCGELVD